MTSHTVLASECQTSNEFLFYFQWLFEMATTKMLKTIKNKLEEFGNEPRTIYSNKKAINSAKEQTNSILLSDLQNINVIDLTRLNSSNEKRAVKFCLTLAEEGVLCH